LIERGPVWLIVDQEDGVLLTKSGTDKGLPAPQPRWMTLMQLELSFVLDK
jgi:hypothetical protein